MPIYLYGSQVLREKAVDADIEQQEEREELTKLGRHDGAMKNADGCGLAAKVGRSLGADCGWQRFDRDLSSFQILFAG